MKVLILSEKYPPEPGGVSVSTHRLAHGLASKKLQVWVSTMTTALPPGVIEASKDQAVRVLRSGLFPRADDSGAVWFEHTLRLCLEEHIDLLHAIYLTQPAYVAVLAGHTLGLPSVISARGNDLERTAFDPAKFSQIAWALQKASAVTAVTRDLQHKAQIIGGREVALVPNSVDSGMFTPGEPDEALLCVIGVDSRPIIAFIGEARLKKGLTTLLPAFGQLSQQSSQPPVLLFIGGIRKDDNPVVQVYQKQHPSADIRIIPHLPHDLLPPYYHLADVLVIPSLRDGLPNTLLEGMACAKAIVATRVGGMADVLCQNGIEDGLLIPPGDTGALTQAMDRLLNDGGLRRVLGQAARKTIETHYTLEHELGRNLEVYRRVSPGQT